MYWSDSSTFNYEVIESALQVHIKSLQRLAILGTARFPARVPLGKMHSFSALETLALPLCLLHNVDEPASGLMRRLHELLPSALKCLMIDCTHGGNNNPWTWEPWDSDAEWAASLDDDVPFGNKYGTVFDKRYDQWFAPWERSVPGLQGVSIVFEDIYLYETRRWATLRTMFNRMGSQLEVFGQEKGKVEPDFNKSHAELLKSWRVWSSRWSSR